MIHRDYMYAELNNFEKVSKVSYYTGKATATIETVVDSDLGTIANDLKISHNPNNIISVEDDGVCVDGFAIPISDDTTNNITMQSDGLYVPELVLSNIEDNIAVFDDYGRLYVPDLSLHNLSDIVADDENNIIFVNDDNKLVAYIPDDIMENTHTHDNKDVLDLFNDRDGVLYYGDTKISGDSPEPVPPVPPTPSEDVTTHIFTDWFDSSITTYGVSLVAVKDKSVTISFAFNLIQDIQPDVRLGNVPEEYRPAVTVFIPVSTATSHKCTVITILPNGNIYPRGTLIDKGVYNSTVTYLV